MDSVQRIKLTIGDLVMQLANLQAENEALKIELERLKRSQTEPS